MRPEGNWVNGQDRLAQQRKILNTVIRPAPHWGENASGMLPNRHGRAEVPGPDPGDFGPAMAVGWTPVRRDFRNGDRREAQSH
jgi:hypothetical protein